MRQFLENATGVDTYLIISLFIFLLFFLSVVMWLTLVDKSYINELKNMPLSEGQPNKKGGQNA
jgi:cytochrome c oxidase cbb3-type subunit IV